MIHWNGYYTTGLGACGSFPVGKVNLFLEMASMMCSVVFEQHIHEPDLEEMQGQNPSIGKCSLQRIWPRWRRTMHSIQNLSQKWPIWRKRASK